MRLSIAEILRVLSVMCSTSALSQQYNTIDSRTAHFIDSIYIGTMQKERVVGLSIAIVDHGEIVYSRGYGYSDLERKITATDTSVYRIASCTKPFTALSILQLEESGHLDVRRSLTDYIPEFSIGNRFGPGGTVVLSDMMAHTAGLPTDIMNGIFTTRPGITWEIQQMALQMLIAPPRLRHHYSNLGYGLLGEVVARQSKFTYGEYVTQKILAPLEMRSSFVESVSTLSTVPFGYCLGRQIREPMARDEGAGSIYSSVIDMSHFIHMLLADGRYKGAAIASKKMLSEMMKDRMCEVKLPETYGHGYGLLITKAWMKINNDSQAVSVLGHSGSSICFKSNFAFIPELKVGVVVLANTDNAFVSVYETDLLRIYLKEAKGQLLSRQNEIVYCGTGRIQDVKSDSMVKGIYNGGEVIVKVSGLDKLSARYGPARFILKPARGNPKIYSGKVYLFGFLPLKHVRSTFRLVNVDGTPYIIQNSSTGRDTYFAQRSVSHNISASWKSRYGKYFITGENLMAPGLPILDCEGMTLEISESEGFLVLKTKNKTGDLSERNYLDVISDDCAVIGGMGQDGGSVVRILSNGHIYYSGFEFKQH